MAQLSKMIHHNINVQVALSLLRMYQAELTAAGTRYCKTDSLCECDTS